ncbi:patatin-like phospholipase family protein [Crenalkalicoccus roseus]|uniref:patatin-like phospholipase family protein n=1 Tax=Crenalkalicoccus roseus TaxID=1485588 RepID=UPI001081800E|nr:patatin-like phospholipase family protein [Crenalkalicoccus roseus]
MDQVATDLLEEPDELEIWARDYPVERQPKPDGIFELAFCMAGAVSAGAYTAGVLDYFVEALDAFAEERRRRAGTGEAPLHEVRVPVLGGASAGGMCAALAAVFLDRRFPPARPEMAPAERRANPLYRAWVSDIDIRHLLGTEDLTEGRKLVSLLDCTVLERIVDGLLDEAQSMAPAHRPWLASPLRAVVTLSNLRGVPYAMRFQGRGFRHWMSWHADYVRYAVTLDPAAGAATEDPIKIGETVLDRAAPRGSAAREAFKAVALGTGSFPVALAPRVLRRPAADYLYRAALTPTGPFRKGGTYRPRPGWAECIAPAWSPAMPDPYAALCVDGGAMNNEPFDLVRRVLVGHGPSVPKTVQEARRALLLIDPFVNPPDRPGPEEAQGLVSAILPLFRALVQNARFKPEDLAAAADERIGSRFLMAPSRGPNWEAEGAIAAGHLNGFLGFFSEAYREHDFLLGRRNARSFLLHHFVLPETNPLFAGGRWSEADRARWTVEVEDGVRNLPIIPLCGDLAAREEPMPAWPAGRFRVEEVAPHIRARAAAVVPALREALIGAALRKPGIWPWLGRQGVRGLSRLLMPRLVEAMLDKIAAEVRDLDEGRHRV